MTIAQGDLVAIHGRIHGCGLVSQVLVDTFRVEDGKLAEHWADLQDEVDVAVGSLAIFEPNEGEH
ncbi:hypothetical protein [Sphingobium yanoikuyae]|uniref:hypothetical protein n=1 Tax=Sphingobium yanoikuyae TaxID=13690 RepID=UPI000ACDC21F|nr:hypothetical protein [Sphingobium yanoikuyae]